MMRKILLTGALIAGFSAAGTLAPGSANAMTITTPAAAAKAVAEHGAVEQVRYVCRRVWTHWGWRRSCVWRPNLRLLRRLRLPLSPVWLLRLLRPVYRPRYW